MQRKWPLTILLGLPSNQEAAARREEQTNHETLGYSQYVQYCKTLIL